MTTLFEALAGALILFGAVFAFIGSVGLVRLPDFFTRLHAPTKATTLGIGSILVGSVIHMSLQGHALSLHELLIALFLFISAPITAHLLAKTALHHELPPHPGTRGQEAMARHKDTLPLTEDEALPAVDADPATRRENH